MSENKIVSPDLAGYTLKLFQSFNTKLSSKENYKLWQDDIQAVLYAHKISIEDLQKLEDDDELNKSFWNVIRLSLSENLKIEFKAYRSVKSLLDAISTKFARNPLIEVAYLERQLRFLDSDSFGTFEQYMTALNDTSAKLKMLGRRINDDDLKLILIEGLSSKYETFLTTIKDKESYSEFKIFKYLNIYI